MERILITGGTGLIGSHLIPMLLAKGYEVRVLSRSKGSKDGVQFFQWDINKEYIDPAAVDGIDHIIHLAGHNVGEGRWTEKRKQLIHDSRIKSAKILAKACENQSLKSFISASGTSIYGTRTSEKIFRESDVLKEVHNDFLGEISIQWEKAADEFQLIADRVVKLRTPVVLAKGSALKRMVQPVKMGIGSPLGSGQQWMPWIHLEDICNAYVFTLENHIKGAYNVVAPEHVNNEAFTKAIAQTINKKLWAPKVPAFVLRLLFGEMADIILEGSRCDGSKISAEGFEYEYPELKTALESILSRK